MLYKLNRKESIINKIILVDGIARTGKSLMGPILSGFENIEIERMENIFEYIAGLYFMKKIEKDAAVILLQLEADTKLYESFLSRNTNFRYTDHSGVLNYVDPNKYFERLNKRDDSGVLIEINKKLPVFQLMTHDVLGMIDPFIEAFGNRLFVIEMARHPIDLVYSWYKRGWGERWTTDPLAFTFTINSKNGDAPWYDILISGKYNRLGEMDRIIFMILSLQIMGIEKYLSLGNENKSKIMWVTFDGFLTNPYPYLNKMESFLQVKKHKLFEFVLRKNNCPSTIDLSARREKEKIIREKASGEGIEKFNELLNCYRNIESSFAKI